MRTVFRNSSHRFGTHLILHFLPPYSPAPFFQTQVIYSENEKSRPSRLRKNDWKSGAGSQRPFWKWKKPGFLWLHATKIPAGLKMITFWKLYKKTAPFNQISSEIRKRAAQSLSACGWYSSKDASRRVCIYGTAKNRVHILPLISEQISVDFSWNYPKKHFRCNLFQVASKVLNKHGSPCWTWTNDTRINSPSLYRLS